LAKQNMQIYEEKAFNAIPTGLKCETRWSRFDRTQGPSSHLSRSVMRPKSKCESRCDTREGFSTSLSRFVMGSKTKHVEMSVIVCYGVKRIPTCLSWSVGRAAEGVTFLPICFNTHLQSCFTKLRNLCNTI
jgi:hypothetical protein